MQEQAIELRKARDIFEILNVTFLFIRQNLRKLFKCILLIGGPFILANGLLSAIAQGSILTGDPSQVDMSIWSNLYLLSYASSFIAFLILVGIVYGYIKLYQQNQLDSTYLGKVARIAFRSFLKNMLAFIVLAVIIIISSFFFLIPGVYFFIALGLTFQLIMLEGIGIGRALSRSTKLITNHWWFTCGLSIIIFIISMVLNYVSIIPYYIALFTLSLNIADKTAASTGQQVFLGLTTIFASVVNFLVYVISLVAFAFHYFNLVERKEAVGLFQRVEQIAEAHDQNAI